MAVAFALFLSPVLREIWDGPSDLSTAVNSGESWLVRQASYPAPPSSFLSLLAFIELLPVLRSQGKQRLRDTFSFPEKGLFLQYLTSPLAPLSFSTFSSLMQGMTKPHDPSWISVLSPLVFFPPTAAFLRY